MEERRKNVNGITLIALVVTIVVLLILATISIQMLGGDQGIIKQAQNSKDKTIVGTYTNKVATICTNGNSELNLSNSIIDRNSDDAYHWETIELHGDLNIDSGKINSPISNAIYAYSGDNVKITISGGIVTSANKVAIGNEGELTITGGIVSSINGIAILNGLTNQSATLIIKGGTIFSENDLAIRNSQDAIIYDGTIYSNSDKSNGYTIENYSYANLTIYGGTITQNKGNVVIKNYQYGNVVYN